MKTSTSLALFASAASARPRASPTRAQHVARQDHGADVFANATLGRLEAGFKLDIANLPTLGSTKDWQFACFGNAFQTEQVAFWVEAFIDPSNVGKVHAYHVPHVEATAVNSGQTEMKMTISESTTTTQEETKGWTLGAQRSISAGIGGANAEVDVSASYSDTRRTSRSGTRSVSHEASCKPGYACRIETWTFHLGIDARPEHRPLYQSWSLGSGYSGDNVMCAMPWGLRDCAQFAHRYDDWCNFDGADEFTRHFRNVNIKVPVYEANGFQLMSRVVLVSEPITKRTRDVSEAADVGTKKTMSEAMAKGIKFQVLD